LLGLSSQLGIYWILEVLRRQPRDIGRNKAF